MLFPYTYIANHSIYTLQTWVDNLFLNVWCKADPAIAYNIDLLPNDIKEITLAIYHNDRITTDYLYGPIEKIYKIFQNLDQSVKDNLIQAYKDNNSIEDLCKSKNGCTPFTYSQLKAVSEPLKNLLEKFCKSLFTDIIRLKEVEKKIGQLDKHYDEFVTINDEGKCPFCGLNSIKGPNRTVRDAYDHFLPKDIYPFSSINFRNLAPMCHECNSSHKHRQDPLLNDVTNARRKAFYPYDTDSYHINIEVDFSHKDISTLRESDVTVRLSSPTHQEQVTTWDKLFGITERYKEKCASKTDGKYWFIQATDEYDNYPEIKAAIPQQAWVQKMIVDAKANKYAAGNFIKAEFLSVLLKNGIL